MASLHQLCIEMHIEIHIGTDNGLRYFRMYLIKFRFKDAPLESHIYSYRYKEQLSSIIKMS